MLDKQEKYAREKARYQCTTIRYPREYYHRLKEQAASNGVSLNELLITYIEWGLENDRRVE